MKLSKISNFFKKTLALSLVGYFSLFSPVTALALSEPVSAPVSVPVIVPNPSPIGIGSTSPVGIGSTTPAPLPTATPIAAPAPVVTVSPTNVARNGTITVNWSGITNPNAQDIFQFVTNGFTQIVGNGVWINNCTFTPSVSPTGTPKTAGSCVIDLSKANIPSNVTTLNIILYSGKTPGQIMALSNQFSLSPITTPKPDLSIDLKTSVDQSNIGVGTSNYSAGLAKINLTATVKNIGSASAQPSVTQINTNNVNEYWRFATNSLAAGASQVFTYSIYKTAGTYSFKAIADADQQIAEAKEDNNTAMATATIVAPKPDLVILSASPAAQLKTGDTNNVDVVVKNIGNATAYANPWSNVKNTIFINVATTRTSDGVNIGNCFIQLKDGIAPGQVVTGHLRACIPLLSAGNYVLSTTVDSLNLVDESNESNNTYNTTFNVVQSKPDLVVLSATAVGDLKVGSYNNLNLVIKNQGTADARSFWVSANTIDVKTTNQLGYCYAYVDKLAAGQTTTVQINYCKQYKYPGQQMIYGKVDEFNMIDESNESNNTYVAYANVINPTPKADYISPASATAGSIAAIYGSNFGNRQGYVTFYNQYNQAVAGASILGWYDGGVKFNVPYLNAGSYQVEIRTYDGVRSNKVSFAVTAVHPILTSIISDPLTWGGYFIAYGSNLGSYTGTVSLSNVGSNVSFYNANIVYWSPYFVIGQISAKAGGNATYGVQLTTSDGKKSPLIYHYFSR